MTRQRDAHDDAGAADVQNQQDLQAARVWTAIRGLVASHPTKQLLRDALDLGRGSGRVKSLIWLAEGPLSLSQLAEAVGVDAPYATLIVDGLEERGLVERQPDPGDRRRKLVTLTAAGREAVARVLRIEREPPPGFAAQTLARISPPAARRRRASRPGARHLPAGRRWLLLSAPPATHPSRRDRDREQRRSHPPLRDSTSHH